MLYLSCSRPSIPVFYYSWFNQNPMFADPILEKIALRPSWETVDQQEFPRLGESDLHVWCVPLELNEKQAELAHAWLSDIQKDKFYRRASAGNEESYLAGRYYLIKLLAKYSACQPEEVLFSYTRLNKPYLSDKSNPIHFNFTDTSHNGRSYGLLAFSLGREIGVDIESLHRETDYSTIVNRRFSVTEQQLVKDENGQVNPQRFLCLWTRKEASGKATGQGINFKMRERDLVEGHAAELNYFDENDTPWHLTQLRISDSLIGCVVHQGHDDLALRAFGEQKAEI